MHQIQMFLFSCSRNKIVYVQLNHRKHSQIVVFTELKAKYSSLRGLISLNCPLSLD